MSTEGVLLEVVIDGFPGREPSSVGHEASRKHDAQDNWKLHQQGN